MPETDVNVLPAEIETMTDTPAVLVAAPGPGKALIWTSLTAQYEAGDTVYTGPTNVSCELGANAVNGGSFDVLGSATNKIAWVPITTDTLDNGTIENEPIVARTYGPGNPTGGNGTLRFTLAYTVLDLV